MQFRSDPPTSKRSVEFFRSEISYSIKTFSISSDQKPRTSTSLLQFRSEPLIFFQYEFEIPYQQFWLFTMAGPSSIRSAFSHDPEVHDFKILFGPSFNVQEANYNLLNKYVVYKVNQYRAMNIEDYSLWESIQMDFVKFEAEHFDELDNATLRVFRDYCYPHGFWINLNLGLDKTCNTAMLEAVAAEWNDEWTLEQIKWVEKRYHALSTVTRQRKQELTGTQNFDSASNPETNIQNTRFQTPLQQSATLQPTYPVMTKQSPYVYQPHQPHQLQQPRQLAPTWISNPVPPTSMFRRKQALLIQAQPAPT